MIDTKVDKKWFAACVVYGAITPIGLPAEWSILVDKAVVDSSYVIIGSGIRKPKIIIQGNILSSIPNAQILESLGNKVAS